MHCIDHQSEARFEPVTFRSAGASRALARDSRAPPDGTESRAAVPQELQQGAHRRLVHVRQLVLSQRHARQQMKQRHRPWRQRRTCVRRTFSRPGSPGGCRRRKDSAFWLKRDLYPFEAKSRRRIEACDESEVDSVSCASPCFGDIYKLLINGIVLLVWLALPKRPASLVTAVRGYPCNPPSARHAGFCHTLCVQSLLWFTLKFLTWLRIKTFLPFFLTTEVSIDTIFPPQPRSKDSTALIVDVTIGLIKCLLCSHIQSFASFFPAATRNSKKMRSLKTYEKNLRIYYY